MLNVGDTVRVISATMHQEQREELIPIGTTCRVIGIAFYEGEGNVVGIIPECDLPYDGYGEFWYLESEVEKGHWEWVKED